jgi:hypothetical protein
VTRFVVFISFLLSTPTLFAQPPGNNYASTPITKKTPKGILYASLGWHRVYYTRSTIRFSDPSDPGYDFRLLKARAIDDNDLQIGEGIDAPQWSIRFGYLWTRKKGIGIELSYDHAKYVLKQGQRLRLQGRINSEEFDKDTLINPSFMEYEHTDGANYYMLSLVKRIGLCKTPEADKPGLLIKAGAGIVIPRTESRVMGFYYNEHYHLSGWVAGIEASIRYALLRNFLAELSVKGVYADYNDVLLWGKGRASQDWGSLQFLFTFAYQLPVNKQ